MERKSFDCLEMKREGARLIYEKIKDMTREQELAYWRQAQRRLEKKWRAAQTKPPLPASGRPPGDPLRT